jgi:hypothetical protein
MRRMVMTIVIIMVAKMFGKEILASLMPILNIKLTM